MVCTGVRRFIPSLLAPVGRSLRKGHSRLISGDGELGGPETDCVRTALDEGWATIIDAPSPTDGDAVAASDIAKRTIANETDQPEHEVEKTDAILAGLAIQYVRDRSSEGVVVLTDDKPAKKGIENAVRAQGYTDTIAVHGLADIIGDDSGDSMRLI